MILLINHYICIYQLEFYSKEKLSLLFFLFIHLFVSVWTQFYFYSMGYSLCYFFVLKLSQIQTEEPFYAGSCVLLSRLHNLFSAISCFPTPQDISGSCCSFPVPSLASVISPEFLQGILVPSIGQWYLETKIWMSSVLIGTGVSLLLSLSVDIAMKYMHVYLHPTSVSFFQFVCEKLNSQWYFLSIIKLLQAPLLLPEIDGLESLSDLQLSLFSTILLNALIFYSLWENLFLYLLSFIYLI